MTTSDSAAATLIWRLWQAGEATRALPTDQQPTSRADGYAIQSHFERFSAKPRIGWKIAATSVAGQRHIGVDQPLAGRLLAERMHRPGAVISLTGNRMRVAEPEFGFCMAAALGPRPEPYTVAEVMAAVGELHLTIELPDSRFLDFAAAGGPSLIADNACARDLVIGPAVTADWRVLDLATHVVTARVGDRYTRDGIGANVLGDPRLALTWLVNELSGLGIALGAGELVTTGTCVVPLDIQPGDHVHADFGVLGTIAVTLG